MRELNRPFEHLGGEYGRPLRRRDDDESLVGLNFVEVAVGETDGHSEIGTSGLGGEFCSVGSEEVAGENNREGEHYPPWFGSGCVEGFPEFFVVGGQRVVGTRCPVAFFAYGDGGAGAEKRDSAAVVILRELDVAGFGFGRWRIVFKDCGEPFRESFGFGSNVDGGESFRGVGLEDVEEFLEIGLEVFGGAAKGIDDANLANGFDGIANVLLDFVDGIEEKVLFEVKSGSENVTAKGAAFEFCQRTIKSFLGGGDEAAASFNLGFVRREFF